MTQERSTPDRAEAIRQRVLDLVKTLTERGKAFDLPGAEGPLEECRQKLQEHTYQVLVVGEAKRGKSTFVNALIGRDLLPTDVDVATSQVFRVCPADREAYRLRFEDDSQMAIRAADLPRYGSQVVADTEEVPRLDQIIRWIEVEGPVSFLPPNVRLLDTPGLGTLYAAHAEITHRFVPHADAVIFVLDSQAPISEPEVRFVEKILQVTPNLLFIQTKIDQFRKEVWQAIQQRNQEVLRQRFGDRLADGRVWPISSTNLRKAAQTGDDDYLLVSRHKELAVALRAFLFRVAGWERSARTTFLADAYHSRSRKILEQRLHLLVAESRAKRGETQARAAERRRQFEADWGERGQKRRDLLEGVRSAAALARQDFRQALQPGGAIETAQRETIDRLQTLDDAKRLAAVMPAQVTEAVLSKWRAVCGHFQTHCRTLLGPFLTDLEKIGMAEGRPGAAPVLPGTAAAEVGADQFARFKAAWSDFAVVGMAGGYGASILAHLTAASLFPPLALAAFAASIWALARGWKAAELRQLREAQASLKDGLGRHLVLVRGQFFDVDLGAGNRGLVEEHFAAVERSLAERIGGLASRQLEEAQAEIDRMTEAARLDDEARAPRAEAARNQLAEWDALGKESGDVQSELSELDRGWRSTPAPPTTLHRPDVLP